MANLIKPARTFGVYFSLERWADCDSIRIDILARDPGENHPVNPDLSGESSDGYGRSCGHKQDGLLLADLRSRIYLDSALSSGRRDAHHMDWQYAAPHSVSPDHARKMVKTFDRLAKAHGKANHPTEIGDWLQVSADALGLTWFAEKRPGSGSGWSYSHSEWDWASIDVAKRVLRDHWRTIDIAAEATRPPVERLALSAS